MTEPFFIVGASRSGTTLMRLALNAHSRMAIPGETMYFLKVVERYAGTGPWTEAVQTFLTMCERRLRPQVDLEPVRANLLSLSEPDFRALLDQPLRQWAVSEGKVRWGEKTPEHIFYSDEIVRLFPHAKVIEMIRDPRAVVASMNRSAFKSSDSTRNAFYWRYVLTTGHAGLLTAVSADRRLSVRYEDLVTDPQRTLRRVCNFLGEDFEPDMLSFHERTSTYLLEGRSVADPKLLRPVDADLYTWRQTLDARQLAITEAICGSQMDVLGYEREGAKIGLLERGEIAHKQAYVAWKHHQQRHKRYHVVTAPPFGRLRHATLGVTRKWRWSRRRHRSADSPRAMARRKKR